MKLKDIGEFGLISLIDAYSGACCIGDDCAIIGIDENKEMLFTTDVLVEGVHFFKNTDVHLLGRKSLAVSLSDIAACGGSPLWALIDLCVDGDASVEFIQGFLDGFFEIADEFGVKVVGGDTVRSGVFSVGVTLVGENRRGCSVMRSGAKPGNDVYVSGRVGCSYAGLVALMKNVAEEYGEFVGVHLNPTPRVSLGEKLVGYATAMIDISDGMVQDCMRISEKSGVGIRLDVENIPLCDAGFITVVEKLTGGEDYELLFCADRKHRDDILSMGNVSLVGEVVEGSGVVVYENGKKLEFDRVGFSHF